MWAGLINSQDIAGVYISVFFLLVFIFYHNLLGSVLLVSRILLRRYELGSKWSVSVKAVN